MDGLPGTRLPPMTFDTDRKRDSSKNGAAIVGFLMLVLPAVFDETTTRRIMKTTAPSTTRPPRDPGARR